MTNFDEHARRWLAGELEPSIGRDAWNLQAAREAELIASIMERYGVYRLLEVGSGVGRLTPHLARHFAYVVATDTSPGMRECTELAIADVHNASVVEIGSVYAVADGALIWDVIDADWTPEQANELVASTLRSCMIVLVGKSRLDDWEPWQGQVIRYSDEWWLLQGDTL